MKYHSVCLLLMGVTVISPLPVKHPAIKKDGLLPPDHLDAVRLEEDGHLNTNYMKELVFGEEHYKVQPKSKKEMKIVLTNLFKKVDTNHNQRLEEEELVSWITKNIAEHLDAAQNETLKIFKSVDRNGNGLVTWPEFLIEVLLALGYNKTVAEKYPDNSSIIVLSEKVKQNLSKMQTRWSQSDLNLDNRLDWSEFLGFHHRELDSGAEGRLAQQLLDAMDGDGDGLLTEVEFVHLPPGDVETPMPGVENSDVMWIEERRKEFRNRLDANRDGFVTKDELKLYVNPKNPNTAITEAQNLIQLADHDHNNVLSLEELLENHDLILGSKLFSAGANFHDDL